MISTRHEARLRRARPDEAEALNAMITRSKSYWNNDRAFVEAYRAALSLKPETIERHLVYCAEVGDMLAGVSHFYMVGDEEIELSHLFVEPTLIGRGIGELLWRHVVDLARSIGARALVFDADPHARPFYEHMGAVVEGYHLSTVVPELQIPRMRYTL